MKNKQFIIVENVVNYYSFRHFSDDDTLTTLVLEFLCEMEDKSISKTSPPLVSVLSYNKPPRTLKMLLCYNLPLKWNIAAVCLTHRLVSLRIGVHCPCESHLSINRNGCKLKMYIGGVFFLLDYLKMS